jgi:hypothetical protein
LKKPWITAERAAASRALSLVFLAAKNVLRRMMKGSGRSRQPDPFSI